MLLIGQFFSRAVVVKFDKGTFYAVFKLEVKTNGGEGAPFSEMNEILSVAVSKQDPNAIYACGYKWRDPIKKEYSNAVTMKIRTNGSIEFLDVWVANETKQRDVCRSVFFDESNNLAVFMMEVVRPTYKDVLVVPMTPAGNFELGAFSIEYGFSPIDFNLAVHSAFEFKGSYYFGAYSSGFNTKIQKVEQSFKDSHIFKINPRKQSSCLFMSFESTKWVKEQTTRYSNDFVSEMFSIQFIRSENKVDLAAYSSNSSLSYSLNPNVKKPKMCADFSKTIPSVNYFGGYNNQAYYVNSSENGALGLSLIDNSDWIFENGTSTNGHIGTWNHNQSVAYIQTGNIGPQSYNTVIRGCSEKNELVEMYFTLNVQANRLPFFATDIQTNWTIFVGD